MAKGAVAKQEVIAKIKEVFPEAFEYGKELRVPIEEDGQRVEIKIALTCAKTNVGGDGASVESQVESNVAVNVPAAAPSEEEKQNIANLMDRLGL
jgi:hypothetical protein